MKWKEWKNSSGWLAFKISFFYDTLAALGFFLAFKMLIPALPWWRCLLGAFFSVWASNIAMRSRFEMTLIEHVNKALDKYLSKP